VLRVLHDNAHYIEKEKRLSFGKLESNFANSSISIPIPTGLYNQIRSIKPDAIIAEGFFQFTPWAVVYATAHRIQLYIAYERTAHTERNCPLWRKLYRRFIGLFVKGYIANGSLTKEYLVSQGVKPGSIFTGGMCADSENLRIQSSKMATTDKEDFMISIGLNHISGLRYIYVGRLIELKGLDFLLDSWLSHIKSFPSDELIIVGGGELQNQYEEQYKDVKSIKFMGQIDYSQIYQYYAISDVFVIPTLEDNWSLVVPEAMACGLPIACSIYNGCHPELVQHGINGTTFDPLLSKSILDGLAYFHHVDLKAHGRHSSDIELDFTPDKTADNVIRMLRS
jgi:glycosyltransferase involved in cell wall biosynthesis